MKTLAELKGQCIALGIAVPTNGRVHKDAFLDALRQHHWRKEHGDQALPSQIVPMLLADWADLDEEQADQFEQEGSGWIVQPKLDGVRCLLHVEAGGVRSTSRCVSEVTYRLSEFQDNLPHLSTGWSRLDGTVLDGELVCPVAQIDTGSSVTAHPLQAAVAILATSPEKALQIQERHNAHLRLHVFDMLRSRGTDVTGRPLIERQDLLAQAVNAVDHPHVETVPSYAIGKAAIHRNILAAGGEGTVWKRLDQPYEPGRRVKHWIKRKRGVEIEAFVTGFKPGTPARGHAHLVGALEFGVQEAGEMNPVAWVPGWTDAERHEMTQRDAGGNVCLNAAYLGRRALITGQDYSAKSKRIRHARLVRWTG